MEITLVGFIIIPVSLYFFIKNKALPLLYIFVFLTPFVATTIMQKEGSQFGMQPSFFAAALLIALTFLRMIKYPVIITRVQFKFLWGIILFWLFSLISLNFPTFHLLLNTKTELINPLLTTVAYSSEYQDYTMTQFYYLTFFLLTSLAIMVHVDSYDKLIRVIQTLLMATLFTCLWGLLVRYPTFFLNRTYPDWIFNNHAGYAQGWDQNFIFIPRLSSVAPEPSMYGFFLTIVFALLLFMSSYKVYVFRKRYQNLLLLLVLLTSIVTTSSTSYLGIFIVLSIFLALNVKALRFLKINRRLFIVSRVSLYIALIMFLLIQMALIYVGIGFEDILSTLQNITINKYQGGSGEDRYQLFIRGISIFVETLGIGTGSGTNRTVDLISTMLANIGLLGMVSFLIMIGGPLLISFRFYRRRLNINYEFAILSLALTASFSSAILLNIVAIPDFIFMYYWLIFGLLLSLPKIAQHSGR
jgi:hypothetical protein